MSQCIDRPILSEWLLRLKERPLDSITIKYSKIKQKVQILFENWVIYIKQHQTI
jgi:hypothetical protein